MVRIQTTNPMRELSFKILNGRWEQFLPHIFLLIFMCIGVPHVVHALPVSDEPQVADHITIQHPANGASTSYTLPIYQMGDIRFISAGVGLEERRANYPPFPLKLIFAQTHGAYLSSVSVTIKDMAGEVILEIPEDQISGPWLFLDLKPGTYQITAVRRDGTAVKHKVQLKEGKKRVTYFHWPAKKGNG